VNEIPKPELLFDLSRNSLQDLQIASLDRAARHLKQAKLSWNEAVREEAIGLIAAYFLEHRDTMLETARTTLEVKSVLEFPERRRA
jgi:hypothetical protein